jgi:FixJ family two-component response regulator
MVNSRTLSVAVVDNDDSVSDPIRILIEMHGWQAQTYKTCESFLAEMRRSTLPDCLVLDLQFPQMSGVELQRNLTKSGMNIPTIVLTAHPDGPLAMSALTAGALEIVTKPVSSDQLIAKIRTAVSTASSHVELSQ